MFTVTLKQICRLRERRKKLHILSDCCPVASVETALAQVQSQRCWLASVRTPCAARNRLIMAVLVKLVLNLVIERSLQLDSACKDSIEGVPSAS
jgi:hypothetical protein